MSVRVFFHQVTSEENTQRLDKIVPTLWISISRKLAQRAITAGGCMVDGKRVQTPSTKVGTGQRIRLALDLECPFYTHFVLAPSEMLLEDAHLLVVNKPSGVPVNLSATGHEGSVQRGVAEYYRQKGITHEPAVIHRLDRQTSGVLLFAKDKATERTLYAAFRDRIITKTYLALVSPPPNRPMGSIETRIASRTDRRNQYKVSRERGKEAITHFQCLWTSLDRNHALLAVRPETGRPHQIRVHLAWEGCPVFGDTLYGGVAAACFGLHAWKVHFPHPFTKRMVDVMAPVPSHWREFCPEIEDHVSDCLG